MDVPATQRRSRERAVDRLRLGYVGEACGLEHLLARGQPRFDRVLRLVGGLAEFCPLGRLQLSDAGQNAADAPALAAQVLQRDRLELGLGLCFRDGRQRFAAQPGRIAHAANLRLTSKRMSAAAAATFSDSTPSLR